MEIKEKKRTTLKEFFTKVFYGDLDKSYIKNNQNISKDANYSVILLVLVSVGIICASLYIFGFFIDFYKPAQYYYLGGFCAILILILFSFIYIRKHVDKIPAFFTVLYSLLILYSIFGDTYLLPNNNGILFYIYLVIVPPLIFTYPYRHYFYSLACVAIYIVFLFLFRKTDTVIYRSITDAIGCYFISCVAVYVSTRQKIMNVRENTALKFDRDTDDLTGLPNRRSFNVAFENYVKGRSGKILSGCIMMDIDDFKMYNDLYGHIEGDNCLIKIGDCLQLISKKYNIMIARYGGEEFCGIITFINLEDIQKIAQDILTSIEELKIPFASKACKRKYVTLSIGVATSNFDDTAMDVLNKADQALYKSKANGKDCITTL